MKKLTFVFAILTCLFLLVGCESTNTNTNNNDNNISNTEGTIASRLVELFNQTSASTNDIDKIAKTIKESDIIEYNVELVELSKKDGPFNGIKPVTDFETARVILPVIGAQPFVIYIFETANPTELEKNILDNYDLRWNMCTAADEIKTAKTDKYLFVVMSPFNYE